MPKSSDPRRRRLEYVGTMAAGLAHEVKNPLSTMSVNLELLADDFQQPKTPVEERTLKRARLLLGEVRRLDGIVNDFLKLARGFDLKVETVDLDSLLTDMLRLAEAENARHRIHVRTSFDPEARHVAADAKYLRIALLNLLVNAQQAMLEKGGDLIVETRRRGGYSEVRLTDTGPGIPEDKLDKIFMPFWSSKPGGTGLGLPTTRRVVEELGGEIAVQSAPGRGTRFVVSLPLAPRALPGPEDAA